MKNSNFKTKTSIVDIFIIAIFIILVFVTYVPMLNIISAMNSSSKTANEAISEAQTQMGSLYDLSKKNSLATSLAALKNDYSIATGVNYTTLTMKNNNSETTIKLTQNFPTKGMTKTEIKVNLINHVDSNTTTEITTILFFR